MESKTHDLVVLGAGPGGYVAAIRAAQLGLNVACIEKEDLLGGTCLRVGCIPSKALLESSEKYEEMTKGLKEHGLKIDGASFDLGTMMSRKDKIVENLTKGVAFLFKKNKITRYAGKAQLVSPGLVRVNGAQPVEIIAKHILIATGSEPATIPGVEFDGESIGSSTEALAYSEVPERLIVIGAGVIGLELGTVWRRLGAEVTVVEYLDRILPGVDNEIVKAAHRLFKRQGLKFQLSAKVTGARVDGEECVVEIEGKEPLRADRVLVSIGRKPTTEGLDLSRAGVVLDDRGFIKVNEHYETSLKGVYAIGDVIGGLMLAHKASDEGVACVEQIVTGYGHINYDAIPGIVYTEPEIAALGQTEEQLLETGIPFNKGTFLFKPNGRAMAMGHNDGLVKILAHKETDRVLGVHIIGPRAGDLIAEAAMAMETGASSEDIARTCHGHPSLSEVLKEAALAVASSPIHG